MTTITKAFEILERPGIRFDPGLGLNGHARSGGAIEETGSHVDIAQPAGPDRGFFVCRQVHRDPLRNEILDGKAQIARAFRETIHLDGCTPDTACGAGRKRKPMYDRARSRSGETDALRNEPVGAIDDQMPGPA